MVGNPTTGIERARARQPHRTTFNAADRHRIIAEQAELRDRLALRLLLDYALRKGALQRVQFRHFDHVRKRLTIFTKGGRVREIPIVDPAFWHDLERLIIDTEAARDHYLRCKRQITARGATGKAGILKLWPDRPMPST